MLQGTKYRAGGLFVWSTGCARDPIGQWPCPCEQGGLHHPGRVRRPQQPRWRRPGPRPSEPPHKEMFVPRRGLWAGALLAPSPPSSSFLLPPPRPGHHPDGAGLGESNPGGTAQPPPCLAPGKARLGWAGKFVGRDRAWWSSFLPCCLRGHPAWFGRNRRKTSPRPRPLAHSLGPPPLPPHLGGPAAGGGGRMHLGQSGPWLCSLRGAIPWSL